MKKKNRTEGLSRRDFLRNTALTAAAFTVVPRHVLGGQGYTAPSDKVNIACVGCGGKGNSDVENVKHENIVALCDVDHDRAANTFGKHPKVPKFFDYRKMLDAHPEIDAVTVSTPDHTHAVIAMEAIKRGKHVFVQKPLTHTVEEARALMKAAKEYGVITQMGNQGHSSEEARLINEWIWDGAIGDVHTVHCWTNRPIWPQGVDRPKELMPVPSTLDWDLWLGPAKYRPYNSLYVPFNWRGWKDFGVGALGDMGAHIMDHPYWALKLGYPTRVYGSSSKIHAETYPIASIISYDFPEREGMAPVRLNWYDGGLTPPRPVELEPGRRMGDPGGGIIFEGTKGKLMASVYGKNPRIFPETEMKNYERPEKTIPRSPGIHEEWIQGIKNNEKTTTDFSYSAPLTETMLLGNIALDFQHSHKWLEYDADKMEFTNLPEANEVLSMEYRHGWSL